MSGFNTPEALKMALSFHRANDLPRARAIYEQILQSDPQNPAALAYLGAIENAYKNFDLAAQLIRKSLSLKPDQASAWNNLASALLETGKIDEAIDALQHSVQLKPDNALAWQNLARTLQRGGRVRESIEASGKQLALQPNHPTPIWNIELCQRELATENAPRQPLPAGFEKWLSLAITCYGDFPHYTLRCIDSICHTPNLLARCDVHVGCNTLSMQSLPKLREHFDAGRITTLIESNRNLNKSPIVRTCLGLTRTPYLLVVDDDSHMNPGWLDAMLDFIERNHPFDLAGHIFEIDRTEEFQKLVTVKPWWKGVDAGHEAYRSKVIFAAGGMYLARAGFLRQHDYPDRGMIIWREDAMLGDLTNQVGGKLLRWPKSVMDQIHHNDGERRGEDIFTVAQTPD